MAGTLPGVNCGKCGRLNEPAARYCQYCGGVLLRREQAIQTKLPTPMPVIGGILLIASALLNLWGVSIGLNTDDDYYWWYYYLLNFVDLPLSLLLLHGVLAIIGLIGGLSAITRKHFGLAFVGGLCGAMGLGIGVGLAGLLFIVVSSDEFESREFMRAPGPGPKMLHVEDNYARYGRRM